MARVLFFDLLGTLVDEASDYEALDSAMESARLRFGIEDPASSLSGDFSLALMEILRAEPDEDETKAEVVPFEQAAKDIFSAVLEVRGIATSGDDVRWFWSTLLDAQRKMTRVHADALTALDWARRQGYRVWVLTDADPYFVTDVLSRSALPRLWDGVVTAAEAGEPKPSPVFFQAALDRAKAAPSTVTMIGDSYERDVLGARGAGILRAILVDRHRARTVDDVPVVSTLTALPAALARLAPGVN